MPFLAFLFYAFIIVIAAAICWAIVNYLPDPPITAPFKNIMRVILLFALLIFIVGWLFGAWAPPAPSWLGGAPHYR